jgi:hypothetical protein
VILRATDMELALTANVDSAQVEREGTVLLPGRLFADVVRSLPPGEVSLELRSEQRDVEIAAGGARFHLRTLPAEDFPRLPEVEGETVKLPAGPLAATVELVDGRTVTALDVQWMYLEAARAWLDARGEDPEPEATAEVMGLWEEVLTGLGRDVMSCAPLLDWVAKLKLLEGYRARDGLAWDDHRLAAIDIQWADVRPEKGLVHRLRDRGMLRDLVSAEEVKAAQATPPEDTRAWFRGECVRRFTSQVFSASWDSVVFDVPGHASLQRVPILEPERGTRAQVGTLLEDSADVTALLRGLATPD